MRRHTITYCSCSIPLWKVPPRARSSGLQGLRPLVPYSTCLLRRRRKRGRNFEKTPGKDLYDPTIELQIAVLSHQGSYGLPALATSGCSLSTKAKENPTTNARHYTCITLYVDTPATWMELERPARTKSMSTSEQTRQRGRLVIRSRGFLRARPDTMYK